MNTSSDRLNFYNIEAEEALLGTLLLNGKEVFPNISFLKSKHFYDPRYGDIFRECSIIFKEKGDLDAIILKAELDQKNLLEKVGGFSIITFLMGQPPSMNGGRDYAKIIFEEYKKRLLTQGARDMHTMVASGELTSIQALERFQGRVERLTEEVEEGDAEVQETTELNNVENYNRYFEKKLEKQHIVQTGISKIDEMMRMKGGNLIVVAGRSGMGKSMFAQEIVLKAKVPMVFFSFENAEELVYDNFVSRLTKTESRNLDFLYESMSDDKTTVVEKLFNLREIIPDLPNVLIEYTKYDKLEFMINRIREYKKTKDIQYVVIDHIGLVDAGIDNKTLEVSIATRRLKKTAMELGIPIIILAQVNRTNENQKDRRPELSTLKHSGSLEEDADVVIGLYRPYYYLKSEGAEDLQDSFHVLDVMFLKNRRGATGTVRLFCDPRYYLMADSIDATEDFYEELEKITIKGHLENYNNKE